VAAFTGLRASELRGLRWCDIDLAAGIIHVRQRADEWGSIGPPKTRTSERSVPIGPFVVNTLRTWKLAGPNEALAFPGKDGEPLTHSVVLNSGYWPAQRSNVESDPQQTSDRKMRPHRTSRPPDVTMYSLPMLADRPSDHGSNR
jgi:integrase